MRIILLGAPGAGKGTQAQFLMEKYGIFRISSGDILRTIAKSNSKLGKKMKHIMNVGKFIPDRLVVSLIKEQILKRNYQDNFLLDGFPRTIPQACAMEKMGIDVNYVLELYISDEIAIQRISGRRIHAKSGRVYHINFNPPKIEGRDDITGEKLTIRKDDQEETVRKRLEEYHQVTESLIFYYQKEAQKGKVKYVRINAAKTVDEIHIELEKIFRDYFSLCKT